MRVLCFMFFCVFLLGFRYVSAFNYELLKGYEGDSSSPFFDSIWETAGPLDEEQTRNVRRQNRECLRFALFEMGRPLSELGLKCVAVDVLPDGRTVGLKAIPLFDTNIKEN